MEQVNWSKALEWVCRAVKCVNFTADVAELAENFGGEDADAVADFAALAVENLAE